MTPVLFVVAAAAGGGVRWALTSWWHCTWQALLAVNIAGSAALGALVGADVSTATSTVVGAALAGSLTTFSAFAMETLAHRLRFAIAYIALTALSCTGVASVAMTL